MFKLIGKAIKTILSQKMLNWCPMIIIVYIVFIYRLCWFGESGYDLLSEQSHTDIVHDSRVQKCNLQVTSFVLFFTQTHLSPVSH